MNRFLTLLFVLLTSLNVTAQQLSQTDEANLKSRLDVFMERTANEDYMGLMDYIYPKIFDFATKEQMVKLFTGLEDLGMDMIIDEIHINKIEPLHEDGDNRYALGSYIAKMRVVITKAELQTAEAALQMEAAFQMQFGQEAVIYDAENHTISINGNKHLIAIKEAKYEGLWYFIEYDRSNPTMISMLLPKDVITKVESKLK